jgi:hypothetical protein
MGVYKKQKGSRAGRHKETSKTKRGEKLNNKENKPNWWGRKKKIKMGFH